MTYFPDLSPYAYFKGRGGLNVGWLDASHAFDVGEAPVTFVRRLSVLHRDYQSMATRGRHPCEFCAQAAGPVAAGNAEIAVSFGNEIYRAPSLILHYVVGHRYLPPRVFIDAVLRGTPVK